MIGYEFDSRLVFCDDYGNVFFMSQADDQFIFKDKVKQWLKSHDFDYKWMADQCGVSEITVRNWMSQKTIPALKQQLIERVMVQLPNNELSIELEGHSEVQVDTSLSLTLKLSLDLYKRLEAKAEQRGLGVNDMVIQAVLDLARQNEPNMAILKTKKVILPPKNL